MLSYAFTAQTWKEITAPWVKIISTKELETDFLYLSLTLWAAAGHDDSMTVPAKVSKRHFLMF